MIYNDYSEVTSTFVDDGAPDEQKLERKEASKKGKKQNTITAYEHKPLSIKEWCLTGRELECLERLDQSLDGTFFKLETKNIRFTNWVGVIGIGRRTIEILPKIDNKGHSDDSELARDRLLYMLAVAGYIPYDFSTEASLLSKKIPPLEVYIRLYVNEACNLLKRGLVHNYIKHEDEITFLRGKLNVAEQVRLTVRRIPRFSVRYHEFSADILLNRIIKDVSRMLQTITQNYENQRELMLIDAILEDVSFERHTAKDVDRIILDRKTYGYERLLALCRLFLQRHTPDFSVGGIPVIPILFDMNKLFERFIGQMLRRMVLRGKLPSFREVQLGKGGRYLLQRANNKSREDIIALKPDIQLFETMGNDLPSIIIDTKWKPLDSQEKLHGITVDDLYQMFAYANRYQPGRTILLYPKTINLKNGDKPLDTFFVKRNSTSEGKIEAWTIDLTDTNAKEGRKAFYESIFKRLENIINPKNGDASLHSE